MDILLKTVLKRQTPYLIGGTVTGTIMAYYYGFLFTVKVNSVIWFTISTAVNKVYWNYTGFKDEISLISKHITQIIKKKYKYKLITKVEDKKESDIQRIQSQKNIDGEKINGLGIHLKF